jgi:hypothetical protein
MPNARGDCWNTPPEYVALLLEMWPDGIDLDPCSNETSIVPAKRRSFGRGSVREDFPDGGHSISNDNGLDWLWPEFGKHVFVNPPWSKPEPWYERAALMSKPAEFYSKTCESIVLTHVATGSQWWQKWVWPHASAVCFHSPRINFLDAEGKPIKGNPRDCSSTYYGHDVAGFKHTFSKAGHVVTL